VKRYTVYEGHHISKAFPDGQRAIAEHDLDAAIQQAVAEQREQIAVKLEERAAYYIKEASTWGWSIIAAKLREEAQAIRSAGGGHGK